MDDQIAQFTAVGLFFAAADNGEDAGEEVAVRNLTFWRDGFSIEDGELRRYDQPGNRELLEAINQGRAPDSLFNVRVNQPVEVRVAKRIDEDWKPAPPEPKGAWNQVASLLRRRKTNA
ncbi:SEP domain-containing protein [Mrakia frigida]|uniref:SEP domain-containing protein n=1 Tax=Mrakia frigida TaxID=29902 RepID=UPI003FCC0BDC